MHSSSRLMSAVALTFLAACSHAASSNGTSSASPSASATASATTSSTASASPTSSGTASAAPAANGGTTISNGNGTNVTVGGNIDATKLGVPAYPGMTQGGKGTYQVTSSNGGAVATYFSDDAFDKVYQFYKSQLPSGSEQLKTPIMAMFSTKVSGDTVNVEVLSKAGVSGTEILITRAAK